MTGYEIIKGNIQFTKPDRIGLRFDRIAGKDKSDVCRVFVLPPTKERKTNKKYSVSKKVRPLNGEYDEWGCCWKSDDPSGADMGQVTNIPIEDWNDLKSYRFPDPFAEGRFDGLLEAVNEAKEKGLYVQLNSPQCIFERMHFLRGFENTLIDCMEEPDEIAFLADRLAEFQIGIIKESVRISQGKVDCYDTTDDWGTQQTLMVSPKIFRDLFKPRYKKIFDVAHEYGLDVRLHSDGKINEIIPDLIELGVDILNIHQPRLVGIDEVSQLVQGKICMEAAVDVQETMPSGDKSRIEAEVKELVNKWATPNGGLIGVEYGYLNAIGSTKEDMLYSLECFEKYGRFI